MIIDKEDIIKLFDKHNINYILRCDDTLFWRVVDFNIFSDSFSIIWYKNLITLKTYTENGNIIEIKFHNMTINGNFPNKFKTNINFLFNNETICVIPFEKIRSENENC